MTLQELTIQTRLAGVKPEHQAAVRAGQELLGDLRAVRGLRVEERQTPATGTKGAVSDVVLALGGPAIVGGVVAVFRLWLGRDARHRSLVFTRRGPGGADDHIEIHAVNVSDQTIREAIRQALDEGNSPDRRD